MHGGRMGSAFVVFRPPVESGQGRWGMMRRIMAWLPLLVGSLMGLPKAANAQQTDGAGLRIERSRTTGLATFVTSGDGGGIAVPGAVAGGVVTPVDFLRAYGVLFGVVEVGAELVETRASRDELAQTHTSYQQVHQGVPVFGGVLRVHQNDAGDFLAANGHFFPISSALTVVPGLAADDAVTVALGRIGAGDPWRETAELVIVDPGWYGDPPAGAHLAYYIIMTDLEAGVREGFFVDAQTGKILDQWNLLHTARNRVVKDGSQSGSPIVRVENGPPTGDFEADAAFDYAGDLYDFLFRGYGRDSLNDAGVTLSATVHLQDPQCPNAYGGANTFFCTGVVTDDIVAHEFTHGLTEFTANLIYQNQSGQLNESFSDVFGEVVDLLNGDAAFPGDPGGTPWPVHPSGPGTDSPNNERTSCVSAAFMTVNSPANIAGDYAAQPASFGPALNLSGTSGNVAIASPALACNAEGPFTNAAALAGKVVLVDRGTCPFTEKVLKAQAAGALAVVVANNAPGGPPPMGGSASGVTIPSVGISQGDGITLKIAVQAGSVNVTLRENADREVRWLVGEDAGAFGGAIRDMWMPSCMGDPDTANHPYQTCNAEDNGGVHSGSGVPNHAFMMVSDGQTFNGQTVSGIGLFKAAAVWHRALTVYLTSTSDFGDAYTALNQSAADLVGEMIADPRDGSDFALFTTADAAEVEKALRAVEMNTVGSCGANEILDPTSAEECSPQFAVYSDAFESGVNGWTVSNTGPSGPPTPYNWVQKSGGLPLNQTGTVWFAADVNIGNCTTIDESAVHSLFSPPIALPGGLIGPTLQFTHYMETEAGYDGGNVKIRVDGGGWQLLPAAAFLYNRYNTTLMAAPNNTNPMAGQAAWSGGTPESNNWGTSLIDLSGFVSGGETIEIRFDFGKDGCAGVTGWHLDDFRVYECSKGPLSPIIPEAEGRKTRSLSFSVLPWPPAAGTENEIAIRVTMIDLQHPIPANVSGNPPKDFTTFDTKVNGICAGGNHAGHHCDGDADCRLCVGGSNVNRVCTSTADCPSGICLAGGTCSNLAACTAAGESNGCARWVGKPAVFLESQENPGVGKFMGARLQCAPYYHRFSAEGLIHVTGGEIVPSSEYSVSAYAASCKGLEDDCGDVSPPVTILTRRSGDVAASFNPPSTSTQPDAIDVTQLVGKFKSVAGSPTKPISQLQPNLPEWNADVSALDIVAVVDGVRELAYAYSGPCVCPSEVRCGGSACVTPYTCVTELGPGATCVKTCNDGGNAGDPCIDDSHCPGGTCGSGFCRDRCGRCTP